MRADLFGVLPSLFLIGATGSPYAYATQFSRSRQPVMALHNAMCGFTQLPGVFNARKRFTMRGQSDMVILGKENIMKKFNYRLVRGVTVDPEGNCPWHALIIEHTLLEKAPRADGYGFETTNEHVIETFTRRTENEARLDAHNRCGELMLLDQL